MEKQLLPRTEQKAPKDPLAFLGMFKKPATALLRKELEKEHIATIILKYDKHKPHDAFEGIFVKEGELTPEQVELHALRLEVRQLKHKLSKR